MPGPDQRAVRTLLRTYWSSAGWVREPTTPPDELAHAVDAGVMFGEPVTMAHDDLVEGVVHAASRVPADEVADAFVASLSTRRLDHRSALGSYAVARHLARHDFEPDLWHDLQQFVRADARPLPPLRFVEQAYPVCWWRAEYGVNRQAARSFGLLQRGFRVGSRMGKLLEMDLSIPYLALPPGWAFVVAPGYEDVWFDEAYLVEERASHGPMSFAALAGQRST